MRRQAAGFTLVELLLAVTLMSILLALAYGGFRAATQASQRGQVLLEEAGRLRITHQFLRRQLNQMLPLEFRLGDSEEELPVMFLGDANRIQFVAPMPGYLGAGGPQVQVLELVEENGGLTMLFRHALYDGFAPEALYENDPVVLLEGLEYAQFEFLTRDEQGFAAEWTTFWEDVSLLPLAVRLDADFGERAQVTWPVLTTQVRVDPMAVQPGGGQQRDYGQTIRDLIRGDGSQQ